jgi:valyl-tRNA synthetase
MGHMLNNTIQDVLIRRARMKGKNACWVPGTDHASIATEAKVVQKLASEGINKFDIGREKFLEHAWEWTHKHGGIILEQLKKLGASCDWDRNCFTMDPPRYESVIKVFVDLYNKGFIYRGVRMVNWDPKAKTALSDEEVIYTEVQSKLYYVKYYLENSTEYIVVATTRPETILGDTAVCVNPNDPRYQHLKGKRVIVPMVNRIVPVIFDEYVDTEFGTGALKITPAHDLADYELGIKHNLPVIDIFNDDGTLNEKAELFVGEDRFVARELSQKKLEELGLLVKVEDYTNKVGLSERTHVPIEPRLSLQWFLRMKELAKPALDNVLNGNIKLYPSKFVNTYRHWMENVKDWCISRQLWWGHRIPAYYLPDGSFVVAESEQQALEIARQKSGNPQLTLADIRQDEDVLDTWFSSWLWPISVFDGIRHPDNPEMKYYYPTNDLVTAPDILFFWVARMIIAGYAFTGEKPFSNVYLTGLIRDKQRRKMSKSLGNSPEPLDLIAKYSADGVRVGLLLCSPAGNDILFDESLTEQGRNFGNKIWNAFRLVNSWKVDDLAEQPAYARLAVEWFDELINQTMAEVDEHFENFRISDALMTLYKLFWDEFSSWYLEIIKPAYQQPIDRNTFNKTLEFFDALLKLLHPFMPFITEELWQLMAPRKEGESIMIQLQPQPRPANKQIIADFEIVKEAITQVRAIRKEKNIGTKDPVRIYVKSANNTYNPSLGEVLLKMTQAEKIELTETKISNAFAFMVRAAEFFVETQQKIDVEEERKKIIDELSYTRGFLDTVMKKLNNDRFVANAPAQVVELEQKKRRDAEAKIAALEARLKELQ